MVWIEKGIEAGNITLRDISRHETTDTIGALVKIDATAKIRRLVLDNITQVCGEGVCAPCLVNEGDIEELIESNVNKTDK